MVSASLSTAAMSAKVHLRLSTAHLSGRHVMDMRTCAGSDPDGVMEQIRTKLRQHCAPVQIPIGSLAEDGLEGLIDLVEMRELCVTAQCPRLQTSDRAADELRLGGGSELTQDSRHIQAVTPAGSLRRVSLYE